MQFDIPKEKSSIIKVIGVGGGGSNAVNHMYKQGIKDVDFIVCNTDRQVLDSSPVPLKIQLGAALTEGLGAGSLPEMGKKAAAENEDEIKKVLANTKMLFITAGMGGGTGTGAAPVIAKIAREMGILTVSICTLPFSWEGKLRRRQAEEGLAELKEQSDSVLVILNDKLREIYHNLKVSEAFAHADNVLSSAAKCIAELINVALRINVDFNDVRRVMENSGVAIMGSAMASGEGRALKAVTQALNSPLLNDNDIRGARYVLVSITCGTGEEELTMDELAEITDYIQEAAGLTAEMIKGYGTDETLADKVSVTIIASGFKRKEAELGFEITTEPQVKMLHLDKESQTSGSSSSDSPKVEISKMTEPMLKKQVVEDEIKEEVKEESMESKKEMPMLRIDSEETSPVVSESSEESPATSEPPAEEIPVAQSEPEIADQEETTSEEDVVETSSDEENTVTEEETNEEPQPSPFMLSSEQEKVSFEFDINSNSDLNAETSENKMEDTTNASADETPKMETPSDSTPEEAPKVDMSIKRSLDTPSTPDPDSTSKVTQIGEVSLSNKPPISDEDAKRKAQEKIQKLRELSFKVKTPGGLAELESEPAYKRKNVMLDDTPHSSDSEISRFQLGEQDKKPTLRPDNSFLHDKPD